MRCNIRRLGFIFQLDHVTMPIYFLLFMLLLRPLFAAQQNGTVRSGDLVIPGATVTATRGDKKIVTTTDESGQYVFKDLPAGVWTLQVDIFGFTAARRRFPAVRCRTRPGIVADAKLA